MADSDRKSYLEMEIQSKSKKLKKKNKIKSDKENRQSQNKVDKNYIRATPLNMVCRGADRDLMYERNEFKLRIPEDQLRMPLTNVNNQIEFEESPTTNDQLNEISIQDTSVKISNAKKWEEMSEEEQVEYIQK